MAMTFDERLEMLQQASRSWLELKRVIDRIPDRALNRPNTIGEWSGRDLLVHLAAWEEIALDVIAAMEAGDPESWPEDEADVINARLLEPHRDSSLDEVKGYLETTHFALMDAAEHASAIHPGVVTGVTADHYAQHIDDLKALAASSG